MSKYCPKCGEELVDEAKFCRNCGTSLEVIPDPQQNYNNFQAPAVENDHTAAIVIGYILAILIPLFAIFMAIYLLTRDSAKAKKHGKYMIVVALVIWFLSFLTVFH